MTDDTGRPDSPVPPDGVVPAVRTPLEQRQEALAVLRMIAAGHDVALTRPHAVALLEILVKTGGDRG